MNQTSASVKLDENKVLIVQDGQLMEFKSPESGYGEHKVIWVHGRISRVLTENVQMIKNGG